MRRVSGILLIVSFLLHLLGVFMFSSSPLFTETRAYVNWERGLLMAAFVIAALGVSLLEIVLREVNVPVVVPVLARLGATAFLIGATVAIVTEAIALVGETGRMSGQGATAALVVVMVVMLFAAEAMLGWALARSGIVPAWVGWTVVAWNIGWFLVVLIFSPGDLYYPLLHFIPLLPIGITALVTRRTS